MSKVVSSNVARYNVKDYGAVGNGTTDDTAAFIAAVAACEAAAPALGVVTAPAGNFKITSQVRFSRNGISFEGAGRYITFINFLPTADGVCFNFYNALGQSNTGQQNYNHVSDLSFISADTTYSKVALLLNDACESTVSRVTVSASGSGGWWKGKDSVGIQTKGHEMLHFNDLAIYASIPFRISKIANTYNSLPGWLSADHFNFHSVLFGAGLAADAPLANGGTLPHACILVDDQTHFSETHFTGSQAWVGGKYGFYWKVDTAVAAISTGITFDNVRWEQGTDVLSEMVHIQIADSCEPLYNLTFNQCLINGTGEAAILVNGVYLKNVKTTSFNGCQFLTGAGKTMVEAAGNEYSVAFNNCSYNDDTRSSKLVFPVTTYAASAGQLMHTYSSGGEWNSNQAYPATMHFTRRATTLQFQPPVFSIGNLDYWPWHGFVRGNGATQALPLNDNNRFLSSGIVEVLVNDGCDKYAYGKYALMRGKNMTAAADGTSPYYGIVWLNPTDSTNSTIGSAAAAGKVTLYSQGTGLTGDVLIKHNLSVADVTASTIRAHTNIGSGYPGIEASSGTPFVNLRAGMWVELSGFATAANNGIKCQILTATSTRLDFNSEGNSQGDSIVIEAAGASVTVRHVCSVIVNAQFWRHEYNTGSTTPLITKGI